MPTLTSLFVATSLLGVSLAACGATGGSTDAKPDSTTDSVDERAGDASDAGYGGADGGPCMPGVPRCHGDFGYQMCDQDGTWSGSQSCAGYSSNGTTSYCAEIPMDGGGTWGTCVDPACWYWLGRGALGGAAASMSVGICEPDGTIERCDAGGTLTPASCDGVCATVTTLDGRALGYCAPACEDGARECLGGPFVRTCATGRWSDAAATCAGACNPVAKGPLPDVRCGGPCDQGTSRCRADLLAVETCAPDGTWVADRPCLLGRCRPAGPQAECETECAPGAHQCAFDGAGAERVCDATGLWMPEAACAAGTTCRLSGDVSLGCVACVGAHAGGGNAFGAADSRCDSAADGGVGVGVDTCGLDDRWQTGQPCPDAGVCASLTRGPSSLSACQLTVP